MGGPWGVTSPNDVMRGEVGGGRHVTSAPSLGSLAGSSRCDLVTVPHDLLQPSRPRVLSFLGYIALSRLESSRPRGLGSSSVDGLPRAESSLDESSFLRLTGISRVEGCVVLVCFIRGRIQHKKFHPRLRYTGPSLFRAGSFRADLSSPKFSLADPSKAQRPSPELNPSCPRLTCPQWSCPRVGFQEARSHSTKISRRKLQVSLQY